MPRKDNQKKKLLALRDVMLQYSDEEHGLTISQIQEYLKAYDIEADRRTLYEDILLLEEFGLEVCHDRCGRGTKYYVAAREFEVPELKLLIDSIQASRFITEKKAMELIRKMERLCSRHQAAELQRGVVIVNRIKNMNESIYYNVDAIHNAINQDSRIRFKYFSYNLKAEREYRHNGKIYEESPYAMVCSEDNYYLLTYNDEKGIIKNYRVDKMAEVQVTGERRQGKQIFEKYDLSQFSRHTFGVFNGEEIRVTMRFTHRFSNVIVDHFGKDVFMKRIDDKWLEVVAPVVISPLFFRWIYGFGTEAYIAGPETVKDSMKRHLQEVSKQYE